MFQSAKIHLMKTKVVVRQKPNLELLKKSLDKALDMLRSRLESGMRNYEQKN